MGFCRFGFFVRFRWWFGVLGLVVPVVGLGLFLGCFYLRVICVIQILRWFGLDLVICVGLRCWLNCLLGLLLSVGFVVDLVDFLAGFVF